MAERHRNRIAVGLCLFVCCLGTLAGAPNQQPAPSPRGQAADLYAAKVRPLLDQYCLSCHSSAKKKGSLDLERFAAAADLRKDLKTWQHVIEQVEAGEMPPKEKPQPSEKEKQELLAWVRGFLDSEAKARVGDPGFVPLRRLSNAEYDRTIRDLTGVDLRPTREFPADGAAGEGFTNAAEALTDISPTLLAKYLNAAKEVADHAVLLPDGFRFSPATTRRDWTDECTAQLRSFYAEVAPPEGKLIVQPYLAATLKHRAALRDGGQGIAQVAALEKLNANYLGFLWRTLNGPDSGGPLDAIRSQWRNAGPEGAAELAAEIARRQAALWETARIGNYGRQVGAAYLETLSRQLPNDPPAVPAAPVRLAVKPAPGDDAVTLRLAASDLASASPDAKVIWRRPRLEAPGKPPLLLKDYPQHGATFEVERAALFANAAEHLNAAAEAAREQQADVSALARKRSLDAAFLRRWIDVLALEPQAAETDPARFGKGVPAVPLELLDKKLERLADKVTLNGWGKQGSELPTVIANSSAVAERIPGLVAPHSVAAHPTPTRFVAVVWRSPIAGTVRLSARVAHAHPACGNGVAWWLEQRRGPQARVLAEGAVELGAEALPPARTLQVEQGDEILLAVDAKAGDHTCDLTALSLRLSETKEGGEAWDLGRDLADSIQAGNPHADARGRPDVWRFVAGPTRAVKPGVDSLIPPRSLLGQWREAAADPARQAEAAQLAKETQALLAGPRPANEQDPNRLLFDRLVAIDGALLRGLELARLGKPGAGAGKFGLAPERFTKEGDLVAAADSVLEVRLPAALLQGREFAAEGELEEPSEDRAVQFQAQASAVPPRQPWDGKSPVVASRSGAGHRRLTEGHAEFRRAFPLFLCFPNVIANDEVVSLKMYHREDEPLQRLFLAAEQRSRLDRLWAEHEFVSQQAAAENAYLPQFIGFVTQDGTKEALAFFQGLQPSFRRRAEEFATRQAAAEPKQLAKLIEFAERAFRRPLSETEANGLRELYAALRGKGLPHEEAFRGVLVRLLTAPAFLFRIEKAPPGAAPGPVDDWELASRLSYFLWSSVPDDELRRLAAAGRLREPQVLAAQTQRMLKDPRARALAIEFGTQWLHVRGFDGFNEKNEKLFPTFDASLRQAAYEEAILLFQDLFANDRPVTDLLDGDATFLNEALAKHYGIPGVAGAEWRRVQGVKQHGRGGVLGLAAVQAKQAGASRTSPILRGNWVVETLLGEKLPKPPPDVPKLPEEEGGDDRLTMRQRVERHTSVASCAACHQRIDPFGFALENYDAIGRRRGQDAGGLKLDARAKLKDGTEFEGMDGLRNYLLTKKKDVIVRLFCRRLLGYALGRAVALSDTQLLDEMAAALEQNEGRVAAAVQAIVRSPQFLKARGSEFVE